MTRETVAINVAAATTGIAAWIFVWVRCCQRELSPRTYAARDDRARR